ncbi:MAG: TetR/AcrR family transcriptional regulator [Bacteroidales bacterium]
MSKIDTKHSIGTAAIELFIKHGIRRITIGDICRKAGICRKTYYDYYNNKEDIVIETLNGVMLHNTGQYIAVMDSHVPFAEKMFRMLDMKIEFMSQRMAIMDDMLSLKMSSVKHIFEKRLNERRKLIINHYNKAQKAGEIRNDICIEVIVEMHNKILDICRDENFKAKFPDTLAMMRQLSEVYLFGIAKR